ncbi:sodium channel protein Nach-like [Leptidea sinapis]|uniref:sodium channel protein Nach-like n=1 Tax=Leptidea sinapis TaxID=189913 RepID=UPI0021C3DB89|nr:sodium channel protein Nach-like [Leptidea sinapis]
MPQQCDDFLKLCYLNGKLYPNCRNLFFPILTQHGYCCIFNSVYELRDHKRNIRKTNITIHKAKKPGPHNGLTVVSDYNPEDAIDGTIVNAGAIRVLVMDMDEFPSDDESSLVHSYTESYHLIHTSYTYCSDGVTALPAVSRECYFVDEEPLRYFNEYHNSDCDLLCHVKRVEKHCGCIMMYIPHVKMSQICDISDIKCIIEVKLQSTEEYRRSECNCPRDCVSYRYRVNMILGNLDALPYQIRNP